MTLISSIAWISVFNRHQQKPMFVIERCLESNQRDKEQSVKSTYHTLSTHFLTKEDNNFELLFNDFKTHADNNESNNVSLSTSS